jgi:tRNA (guanine-N7-)-methyltransferase
VTPGSGMSAPPGGALGGLPARRNFYGRRHGKALKPSQRRHLAETLPRYALGGVSPVENPERRGLAREAIFGDGRPLWLEIGFGAGEHLVAQAAAHPNVGLIGCEPFVNGVAACLAKLEAAGMRNVRILKGDARDLIELLSDGALDRVFLLYPDPWPKKKHRRRRFATAENLGALARAMAPGAELRLATDISDYAEMAAEEAALAGGLEPVIAAGPDWHRAWPDWSPTRYEMKALAAGRRPHYLTFRRR